MTYETVPCMNGMRKFVLTREERERFFVFSLAAMGYVSYLSSVSEQQAWEHGWFSFRYDYFEVMPGQHIDWIESHISLAEFNRWYRELREAKTHT